jgi:hypothetical protein
LPFDFVGVMGIVNTLVRFAENTHKYGPFVAKSISPVVPPIMRFNLHPMTPTFVFVCEVMALGMTLGTHLDGDTSGFIVGPDGTVLPDYTSFFPLI